jgi:hypothetical protein
MAKGSVSNVGTFSYEDPENLYFKQIVPPNDINYESDVEFALNGDSIRHRHVPQAWSPELKGFKKTPELSVWTDKHHKYLYENGSAGRNTPQGGIQQPKGNVAILSPILRPMFATLRPTSNQASVYSLDKLKIIPRPEKIRGRPCVQGYVVEQDAQGTYRFSVWYDVERDYSLVREVHSLNGTITRQMDIDYAPNETVGWLPSRWNWSRRKDPRGSIDMTIRVEAVRAEFNQTLNSALFDIAFPVGTAVIDSVSDTMYMVQPDGRKEVFYSQPVPQSASGTQFYSWVWGSIAVVVLVLLIYVVGRISSRLRKSAS